MHVAAQPLSTDLSALNFGSLVYGQKDSMEIELINLLTEDLVIEDMQFFDYYVSTPFYVTNFPTLIPVGGSASIYVVYEPIHNMQHNSELVVKTSGNRGAISVDLRGDCTYAIDYYEGTHNLLDEDLKTALNDILGTGYQEASYDVARDEMFMVVDNQLVNGQGSAQNTVTGVYTGEDAVGYANRQQVQQAPYNFNTEHIYPQGMFNQNLPMRSDLHHLAPTKIFANSARGNLRFGEVVSGVAVGSGGSMVGNDSNGQEVFEPRDEQKGNNVRAIMYFVLRYQNYGGFMSLQQANVCRDWNRDFPPDGIAIARNEAVYDFQNNRNPFVDYPQFADRIYAFHIEQDRPNVGDLQVSHESVDFGYVPEVGSPAVFQLVLTNIGERFLIVSDFALENNASGVFTFDENQSNSEVINVGESVSIPIHFTGSGSADAYNALLTFSTNLAGSESMSLPVSVGTVVSTAQAGMPDAMLVPNPFGESLHFTSVSDTEAVHSVWVYDISGRLCKQYSNHTGSYSTGDLDPGIYHFVVEMKNGTRSVQKMVRQ